MSGVMPPGRKFRLLHFSTLVLSLLLIFTPTSYAEIRQWNFDYPEDYTYESEKIEVANGVASLRKKPPFTDSQREDFDRGTYEPQTQFADDHLELSRQQVDTHPELYLPEPQDLKMPGLISLWHLDEPSGTNVLDTVNNNVAKASDAEVVSGQNGFKYARLFDGQKSHIFIPQYENFRFNRAFSVEAWIRPILPVKGKAQTIISRWQSVGSQKSFALQLTAEGKMDFKVSNDGATTVHQFGNTVLTSGKWHHVAGIFTGHELRVYVNGVLDSPAQSFEGPIFPAKIPMYFGALIENKMDEFFEGVIDEVAFYSRPLTEVEVLTHDGNSQGLVAFWRMDEKAGVLSDSSGYGHNGLAQENPDYGLEGKQLRAIHLNGKSYFEVPPSGKLAPQGEFTVEAWINPDRLPGKEEKMTFLSSQGGDLHFNLSLIEEGRLQITTSSLTPSETKSYGTLMPRVWQHLAVTWGGQVIRIYINGKLDSSFHYEGFFSASSLGLILGMHSEKTDGFEGSLDELMIFRRAKNSLKIVSDDFVHHPAGFYTSSVKDAGSPSPWQFVKWKSDLNYGNEISNQSVGLIHHYSLNEAEETLQDIHEGGFSLTAIKSSSVPGKFKNAQWFSEPGSSKVISQNAFPSLSTFSVSLWFQFASSHSGLSDRIFSIGDENPSIYRSGPDGRLYVVSAGAPKLASRHQIQDTRWHHLVLSSDGQNLFLYIDGTLSGHVPFVRPTSEEPLVLGNLKSSDSFKGAIDEFVFFNKALNQETISNQYIAGMTDAKLLVRASNQESFSQSSWRGPLGPNLIEREPGPETAALWHFNEASIKGNPAEIHDSASLGLNAKIYGSPISAGGAMGRGLYFNGTSDFAVVPASPALNLQDGFTLSAWIKPMAIEEEGSRILDKHFLGGAPIFSSYSLELAKGNRLAIRLGHEGGYHVTTTDLDGEIGAEKWNHVAATYNRSELRLYINGKLSKKVPFKEPLTFDEGALYIGRYGSADGGYFNGGIDEVSLDHTAATEQEIAALFSKANPENFYRPFEKQKLHLEAGRYFQYQTHLSTSLASISPEIQSIQIRGNDFSGEVPSIVNNTSVSFADLSGFRQQVGAHHQGAISYQLSNDSANWFYHNGRRWVVATSLTESNTANQIASRISNFPKDAGIGSFYFRAFLHSPTGLEPVELEGVEIDYMPNKITVTSPNGGEAWLVGAEQTLQWNSAGELLKVRLEYSKDNFKKDFHVIAEDVNNTGSYLWHIPDDVSPTVKVRVLDQTDPRIYDLTDFSFRLIGAFEMISPNYQERWEVGSKQKIAWRTLGTMNEVKLDYSTDEFKEQIYPIIDSVKNDGQFEWTVPDTISNQLKVRVSDVRDPLTLDKSNDTFSIVGKIEALALKANSRFTVGSTQEIRWNTVGSLGTVKIEYQASKNDFGEPEWKRIEPLYTNQGFYLWKVPDAISNQVTVRISDAEDAKIFSETSPFAIVGNLKVIHPTGGEFWTVGSKRKIAWESTGTIPSVDVEYAVIQAHAEAALQRGELSPTSDLDWKTIEKGLTNVGSYVWQIPKTVQDKVIVRVLDSRDPLVSAATTKSLELIPGLILTSPNGGEAWKVGTDQNIEWQTSGSVNFVKIEYSKDHFQKDVQIVIDKASNLGAFSWTVPADTAKEVWIRVSDLEGNVAYDLSDAPFRIYGGFWVVRPIVGEKFEVGSLSKIEWKTTGNIQNVKLEYSHDDFNKDARVIAENISNKGEYTWTIPDDIGAGYSFRISDVKDPQAFTITSHTFSIVGKFYLTFPKPSENLIAGTLQKITWKGAGSIPYIRLDYSEDDFKKSYSTIAEAAPNTGAFEWQVPNRAGHHFKIRIWDPSNPDTLYVMDNFARIVAGFTLDAPNGGEILYVDEPYAITWKTYGMLERVKLEFSNDQFQKNLWEITDSFENIGRYRWLVPVTATGLYRVRVSDPKDVTAYDISNSDFRIRSRFALLSPIGGEGWKIGETQEIKWQTRGSVAKVKLEYSVDDFKSSTVITEEIENQGTFSWQIPDSVSQKAKVKVSDMQDRDSFAISDAPFRIQGKIKNEAPEKGVIWRVGETYPIVWKTQGNIPAVTIEYSRDAFVSEAKPIIESTANSGSYDWTVPDEISEHAQIRIVDLADKEVKGISGEFQVAPSFQILAPNGKELWHAMERREINWVTVGTVPEVDLRFCEMDSASQETCFNQDDEFFVIDRGVLNTGRYTWDIPRIVGEQFKVQVCDSRYSNICDESDLSFKIEPQFKILYPQSSVLWPVGTDQEIRWQNFGDTQRVLVQYASLSSMDDLNKKEIVWKTLGEGIPNEGKFIFRVPNDISNFVVFKVADWDDEALYDITEQFVDFTAVFKVYSPNGGEKWAAGSSQAISWDTTGSLSNVTLEYSTDNFEHEINLIESSYTNVGNYQWTVPPDLSKTVKVRVSDPKKPAVFDHSDDFFKIHAGFILLSPNGGEIWTIGNQEKIQWKALGEVSKVRLEYRNDKGEWRTIAEEVPNTGTYEWKVADETVDKAILRISDQSDVEAFDLSDSGFEIRPSMVVTAPNGEENYTVGKAHPIKWVTIGTIQAVNIEYSKDGFKKDIRKIAEDIPNEEAYTWTPSDDVTDTALLRVQSAENPEVFDLSDAAFKILPRIEMVVPKGEEQWSVGSRETVEWDWRGSLDKVNLEYSANDFASATLIERDVPNTGKFHWEIPDTVGNAFKLRVLDSRFPDAQGISAPFKIVPGFEMIKPNGGERWSVGETHKIQWKTLGTSESVALEYSPSVKDGARNWKSIEALGKNIGSFDWKLPSDISSDVLLRVRDGLNPEAMDVTDASFKILGRFNLLSPRKDDVLLVGDKAELKWETFGNVPSVQLEMKAGEASSTPFQMIEPYWNNSGNYFWTVPDSISENVYLKISDTQESEAYHISEPFIIRGILRGRISAEKLNWPVGSTQTVFWDHVGTIPYIHLHYQLPGSTDWKVITEQLPNAGSYGWQVPDDVALGVSLRISDASNPAVYHVIEPKINIAPRYEFKNIEEGEIFIVGQKKKVEWRTEGKSEKIQLEYSSGDSWQKIEGPIFNANKIEWNVPDHITDRVRLKISDAQNEAAFAVSSPFAIRGELQILRPEGGELWEVASAERLKWQTTGTIPTVRLVYRIIHQDNFEASEEYLIQEVKNENGFDWTVPDHLSDFVRIRVSDARDVKVFDESDSDSSIIAAFEVRSPKGGETWPVGSIQQIIWDTQGTVPSVVLEFSADDFKQEVQTIATDFSNTGNAVWTIPDAVSSLTKVRVSDSRDYRAYGISPAPFKIRGTLNFEIPKQDLPWVVGSVHPILWSNQGTIPNVRLEYSTDDFQKDVQVIENSIPNQNHYGWKVPDKITENLKLRIVDAMNGDVGAVSEPLKIRGDLELIAPTEDTDLVVLGSTKVVWNTTGTIPKIRLDYSRDGFRNDIHLITTNTPNDGTWKWQIPDDIGTGLYLRVSDELNPNVQSVTPYPLKIRGAFAFIDKNEKERWVVGSVKEIAWNTVGSVPQVRLEYSKEEGFAEPVLITDKLINRGAFFWTIPDDFAPKIRIRITDNRDPAANAVTQSAFAITGALKLEEPKARTVKEVGTEQWIRWTTTGTIPAVRLEYSIPSKDKTVKKDETWEFIASAVDNTGSYEWVIPNVIADPVKIRVSDLRDPLTSSTMEQGIAIIGGLELLEPRGGERWIVSTPHEIKWNSFGNIPEVLLEMSTDGFQKEIKVIGDGQAVNNTGHYLWTVPDQISDKVQVRIRDAAEERTSITSRPMSIIGDFVYLEPVRQTALDGSVLWRKGELSGTVGSQQQLEWKTVGTIPAVKLEYSAPSSDPAQLPQFHVIQGSIPNSGKYEWTVPDKIGSGILFRISDARDATVATMSQKPVKIQGDFELKGIEPGTFFRVDSEAKIQWKTFGTVTHVDLEYSTDRFQQEIFAIDKNISNTGSYAWKVPDTIGADVILKVTDSRDPAVLDLSDAFEIRGALKLLPPAEKILTVGETVTLPWESTGTIPTVALDYSTDEFEADVRMINPNLNNSGSYEWTIPDAIASKVWVRVADVRDAQVNSLSGPFEIQGGLAFVRPTGGESFIVGSKQTITWESQGSLAGVRLEYSNDGFIRNTYVINEAVANSGSYTWEIPDFISKNLTLRLSDVQHPDVFTESSPFKIRGNFVMRSLAKDEVWNAGDKVMLEWETIGTIPHVRLDYSGDHFENDFHTIFDVLPNRGSASWKIPAELGGSIQIRVRDAKDPEVYAVSSGSAKISGVIQILKPEQGAVFRVGNKMLIQWVSAGAMDQVNLDYSRDGFQKEVHPIETATANQHQYEWKVPDAISGHVQVRVQDSVQENVFALSKPFGIQGGIELLEPQGGETFKIGSIETIAWKTVGTIPHVRLEFSSDQFKKEIHIIDQGAVSGDDQVHTYAWEIPDFIANEVWLRIVDVRDKDVFAVTSKPFSIEGALELLSPKGGESFVVGDPVDVRWKTTGSILWVRLEMSRDAFVADSRLIEDNVKNDGEYEWKFPETESREIWIRVADAVHPSVGATHDLALRAQGRLEITRPLKEEIWKVGSEQSIEWKTLGKVDEVRLEYFVPLDQAPASGGVIEERLANQGSYIWKIPANLPPALRVRVVSTQDPSIDAMSLEAIRIQGNLHMVYPNKTEVWPVGSTQQIAWESEGVISQVNLEYSRDGFKKDAGVIASFIINSGKIDWTIPDIITSSLSIRVSDAHHSEVMDITREPIQVVGTLHLESPHGGERWSAETEQDILWSSVGTVEKVDLEYSNDQFTQHKEVIASGIPNTGRFDWTLPKDLSQDIWIAVRDSSDNKVLDAIQVPVHIPGKLSLKEPQGSKIFHVGDHVSIAWDTVGHIPSVRLEYSTDGFLNAFPIAEALDNDGSFDWRIPDAITESLKIRVSDLQDPAVSSESLAPIKIQGELGFLTPSEGDFWITGSSKVVTWKTQGSVPYVNLEYSADNFMSVNPIILGLANEGSYAWSVPKLPVDQIRFRISNAMDQSIYSTTGPVTLGGSLELVSPLGGEVYHVGEESEIRWNTQGLVPEVRIEISKDQFKRHSEVLAAAETNQGRWIWKIGDNAAPALWMRISDARRPKIYDFTKAPFKITGRIELLSPRGGEVWKVGVPVDIRWRSQGTMPQVRLEYSADDFKTMMPIVAQISNTGSYQWHAPDMAGSSIKIRLSDAQNSEVSDTMDYGAEIEGDLELLQPSAGQTLRAGEQLLISWRTTGTIPNVNIEYSEDDFAHVSSIAKAAPNQSTYLWTVPNLKTHNLKIRIANTSNPKIMDTLNAGVSVFGDLMILSPHSGEVVFAGSEQLIQWSSEGSIDQVRIDYSQDHFKTFLPIANAFPNSGKYAWKIPEDLSGPVKIRITDVQNTQVYAEMSKPFVVRPVLNLLSPEGGESWAVYGRYPITWQSIGQVSQVRIDYSQDDFENDVHTIVADANNKGIYYWDIPETISGEAKIRISDSKNPEVFDLSKMPFQIVGDLDLIYPAGHETFQVGERVDLLWKSSSNIPQVKLEYSEDDFKTVEIISQAVSNTGKFSWHIPALNGKKIRLRISDAHQATVFDTTPLPFEVVGALEIEQPLEGTILNAGSDYKIHWTTRGTVPYVRLDYSPDHFKTVEVIAAKIPNTGSYDWKVSEILYPSVQLRISDPVSGIESVTQNPVQMQGRLILISPNGGERLIAQEETVIRWQTYGPLSQVTLEYSKDHFLKDIHLIASNVANLGNYFWTIPNDRSDQVRVRLSAQDDRKIFSVSAKPFKIDHYQIRWNVKDLKTGKDLSGLLLTDSFGETKTDLASPAVIERPYGIYTTSFSKPGYQEFKNSWVADNDKSMMVHLEPHGEASEQPRVDFDYDQDKDLMKIKAWFEKDAKPVPAVIHAEVRIYEGTKLIQVLSSANPDASGYFQMIWDTSAVPGNSRYLASASITRANGKIAATPMSFLLNIPVKKPVAPQAHKLSQKPGPIAQIKPPVAPTMLAAPVSTPQYPSAEIPKPRPLPEKKAEPVPLPRLEGKIIAPEVAVIRETISIQFKGDPTADPVLDLYDANRKLIVRAAKMQPEKTAGHFSYLLPIEGLSFIPGEAITVSVIDRETGQFVTHTIRLETSDTAIGLSRQIGTSDMASIIQQFSTLLSKLKDSKRGINISELLVQVDESLARLAALSFETELPPPVVEKLNQLAQELARIVEEKGYDADYLMQDPLSKKSSPEEIVQKMRQFRTAAATLARLYYYSHSGV